MGVKYTHTFHQLKKYDSTDPEDATEWRIDILQDSWVGASTEVYCDKDSIVLSREGDLLDVVQGTKLSVSLINQTEGQYKEFREADWGEYEVRLWKNGNNSSELPTPIVDERDVNFTSSSDVVDLGNIDGLGGLSSISLRMNVKFSNGAGNAAILYKNGVISILYNEFTGTLTANLITSTGTATATASVINNVDYDIYISYQSGFFVIFVDEVQQGFDVSQTGTIASNTNDMYIGGYGIYSSTLMELDYIKIYQEIVPFDSGEVLKFVGYNQSEIYTEPFDQPPYSSVLEFTCGLNHLKNVRFDDQENIMTETGVDANTNAVSPSVDLTGSANGAKFKVDYISGTHENLVIEIQTSPDDITWTSQGNNVKEAQFGFIANYVRLKVTTVEGAASVIDWSIEKVYTGRKTIIEVLRLCLNKLPNTRSIIEFVNIYEDNINSTTTDSMLNQIYVDCSVYKEEDKDENKEVYFYCHKVLTECLRVFGVNLYQANGEWYIARVQEYSDSTIYYRLFSAFKGSESNLTITSTGSLTENKRTITGPTTANNELILVAPASELSIEPPLNRLTVTYNQKNIEQESSQFIRNGDFVSAFYENQTYVPQYWNYFGINPYTYRCSKWRGDILYFNFGNAVDGVTTFLDEGQFTTTNINITDREVSISTLDSMVLNFKMDFYAVLTSSGALPPFDWVNSSFKITVPIVIKFGDYFLQGSTPDGFSWVTGTGVQYAYFEGRGADVNSNITYTGFQLYSIDKQFEMNTVLPNLPISDNVEFTFQIMKPYTNLVDFAAADPDWTYPGNAARFGIADCKLTYLPLEVEPTEELVLNTIVNDGENLEQIEVYHADGTNTGTKNSYRLSNGLITDQWTRRGLSDNVDILNLFLNQLGNLKGDFTRILNTKVIGEIDIINTIEQTTDTVNEYYIKTYSWNIATNEYDLTLSEIGISTTPKTSTTNLFPTEVGLTDDIPLPIELTYEKGFLLETTETSPTYSDQATLNNYI